MSNMCMRNKSNTTCVTFEVSVFIEFRLQLCGRELFSLDAKDFLGKMKISI